MERLVKLSLPYPSFSLALQRMPASSTGDNSMLIFLLEALHLLDEDGLDFIPVISIIYGRLCRDPKPEHFLSPVRVIF